MSFGQGGGSYGYGLRGESWQQPLFKIGRLPINVTALVILVQIFGMLSVVFFREKMAIFSIFVPEAFLSGAVWQAATYPFFELPSIMLLLGLYFFYRFGGLVEETLGRGRYVHFLLATTLIPPVLVVLASLLSVPGWLGEAVFITRGLPGSHLPHLAVFVAAISMMPNAPTMFFGFPIKWLAVAFIAIGFLQYLVDQNYGACIALVSVVYLALWWMKQAGHVSQWGVVEDVLGPRPQRTRRKGLAKKSSKKKRVYEKKLKPRTKVSSSKSKDIDRILDKINENGLHSLTEDERQILQKESKR